MPKPQVALVNCLEMPEPDPDESVLVETLRERGLDADWVAWDDPKVKWAGFDIAILRSAWNYHRDVSGFRTWVAQAAGATRLLNSPEQVFGNLHKAYLLDLEKQGIPIVPTRIACRSSRTCVSQILEETGWERFVVKPAISAASYKTRSFYRTETDRAESLMLEILEEQDVMIQPFLPEVANDGEINLVHIGGELSHGVIKHPRFADDEESVSEAVPPSAEQTRLAEQVMSTLGEPVLYARVDLMRSEGRWLLSELELIEPSLFFLQSPKALRRFCECVHRFVTTQNM